MLPGCFLSQLSQHFDPLLGTWQIADKGTWHFMVESSGGDGAGPRPGLAACVTPGSVLAHVDVPLVVPGFIQSFDRYLLKA